MDMVIIIQMILVITSVEQNQNNLNNLSLKNEYIASYNNTQLQNVVENYTNDFYSQNINANMDPYYLTQSYNNNIDAGSYNLTSNYIQRTQLLFLIPQLKRKLEVNYQLFMKMMTSSLLINLVVYFQ